MTTFTGYEFIHNFLKKNTNNDSKTLEIGCGEGFYRSSINGYYLGTDLTSSDYYPGRPRKVDLIADACNLHQIDSDSFNFIFGVACFYLMSSKEICLMEAYRVLTPGGKLVFFDYTENVLKRIVRDHHNMIRKDKTNVEYLQSAAVHNFNHVKKMSNFVGFQKIERIKVKPTSTWKKYLSFLLDYTPSFIYERYGIWNIFIFTK